MFLKTILFLLFSTAIFSFADNILSNGDMEYGDGGWYLWNNPAGPAEVEYSVGKTGIGVNGSQGAIISIKKKPKDWWGLQLQTPKMLTDSAFYTLEFTAKGKGPLTATIQGGGPDYRQKESIFIDLTPEWKTYSLNFLADQKGYGLNNVVFQIGHAARTLYIDNVTVTKAQNMDDSWYLGAEARIDSLRKKDFSIQATPGAKVSVELVRHEFPFGTALALYDTQDSIEKWYRKTATKYFWYGVSENQFKWPEYEPKKGTLKKEAMDEYIKFTESNGWQLRGHALIWAIQGYGYDKHWSIQGSCKDIASNLKKRIDRDLKEYKGKITEYDVWNEPFHEPFLFDKCGWGLLDSAFVWAHRADPSAALYINEYNVVAAGETDRFYELVKGMLQRKVPVQGLGVQCHFQARPVIPAMIRERLDKLGSLGLPIKVTELDFGTYDQGLGISETQQAIQYEMFLRTAFSHPAIQGILLWGFWDNRHWIKNGGIIASDGREKTAAKVIYDLWHKTWTTQATLTADKEGIVRFRGFPGKYKVTIDGKSKEEWLK